MIQRIRQQRAKDDHEFNKESQERLSENHGDVLKMMEFVPAGLNSMELYSLHHSSSS